MTKIGSDPNAPKEPEAPPSTDTSPERRTVEAKGELRARQGARVDTENVPSLETASAPLTPEPPTGIMRQFELVERVRTYDPHVDGDLLDRAYVFAMLAHGEQTRSSGDPYFSHPVAVAGILTDLKLDPACIATALLHDVVEDTDVTLDEIREKFGDEVAMLVDGVTKISKRELAPDADGKAENFVKFVMATAKDIRILLIKLADRLHNMRTLHFIKKKEKRERIAAETMEIFAPLAGRIGVNKLKEELEDLSFQHLNPNAFKAINEGLERLGRQGGAVRDIVELSQRLKVELEKNAITADIRSREKRAFSIWRKMQRKGSTFEEIADIYAFRVIVDSTEDCYKALGVIHQTFPMIPGEFDDYISTPKPNGYRSIHTAVLASGGPRDGQRVEIQIRSAAMHDIAERGVAAHWRYKDASARQEGVTTVELGVENTHSVYEWVRGVMGLLDDEGGASAFLDQARIDLYQDQVFPFTPRGRVIPLPKGSTAVDFAYALHTDVGDEYAGAKINGVQRPNRTRLRNGDVVEILRSDHAQIPSGWESYVITGAAKSGLRRRVRHLQKQEHQALGERIISSAFAARKLQYTEKAVEEALKRLDYPSLEELFIAVGRLDISGQKVLAACFPNLDVVAPDGPHRSVKVGDTLPRGIVALAGVTVSIDAHLARCCGPLPGERIIGLFQDSGDVDVHRIDCASLEDVEDEHWLNLAWQHPERATYITPITITVNNKTGALGHIGTMLARYDADIANLHLENNEADFSDLCFEIGVRDIRHLNNVLTGLRASDFVVSAVRASHLRNEDENE